VFVNLGLPHEIFARGNMNKASKRLMK